MTSSPTSMHSSAALFKPVLLVLTLSTLVACPAFAKDRLEEPARDASARVTLTQPLAGAASQHASVGVVHSAVVNFADIARQEALRRGPARAPRPMTMEEEVLEPAEPLAPANSIESASPPSFMPFVAGPSPTNTFQGLDDIPMVDSSYIIIPPDVAGGVGPTRVMDSHNNNYRVLDKCTGATIQTVGTATFWNPVVTNKLLLSQLTDPRTVYDPINNRWIVAMQTIGSGGQILLGVSQSDDPAGSWFLYAFGSLSGSGYQVDYPILGFNKNWVCVTINMYNSAGSAFQQGIALVASYPQARAGTLSSATVFTQTAGTHFCTAPCVTLSASEDSLYLVTHLSSAGATYAVDVITGSASPSYTSGGTQTRPGGGWVQPNGNQLPQSAPSSGTSVCGATPCMIETQDSQVRSAPVFRVDATTGRQFIYYSQTVGLPSGAMTHTGVQWTKLTASATTPAFADGGRIEDPTATATNGGKWYAFTHVAVNSIGDMIVGYSQFSSAQHPSAGYSYRDHADALGSIRDPFVYKAGEDYYHKTFSTNTGRNRWGDFTTAQVDPSDDRSLWVLQEYAKARTSTNDGTTGANGSRWSTYWANVGGPVPTVSIATGPSQNEGNAGTTPINFTVNLSAAYTAPVSVNYQTANGTATGSDYQTTSGTLTICPPNTSGTITVLVNGDTQHESNETFTVTISAPVNATLGPAVATGTIQNDDPVPTISIGDVSANEGNAGTTSFNFTVSLSNTTDQVVSVNYQTADGSATLANNDYQSTSGTLAIPAGNPSGTVTVPVNGDTKFEGNETFVVNLSAPSGATISDAQAVGTIQNDDSQPSLSIGDVSAPETNVGTTSFSFTVSLSNASDQDVTVHYATSDGSAKTADNDYDATSGDLTIPAKTLSAQVTVPVHGDLVDEDNEDFFVNLSAPVGAVIADSQGKGTIQNDDSPSATVLSPNGGELELVGTSAKLAWLAPGSGVTTVDLFVSRTGNAGPYETISLGEPNTGTYLWTVTGPPTIHAILRVVAHDVLSNSATDESDADWIIRNVTTALMSWFDASPTDDGVAVQWQFVDDGGITAVALERSDDGGASWRAVDASVTNAAGIAVAVDRSVESNRSYTYRLLVTWNGEQLKFGPASVTTGDLVREFAITGVRPNPAPGRATVIYTAPKATRARLTIVDVQGRVVATVVDGLVGPGRHEAVWHGETSSGRAKAGVYFARYEASGKSTSRRFMLMQ